MGAKKTRAREKVGHAQRMGGIYDVMKIAGESTTCTARLGYIGCDEKLHAIAEGLGVEPSQVMGGDEM